MDIGPPMEQRKAQRGLAEKTIINLLLALALALFVIGVSAPMLTLTKLFWISNTFSVLSGIKQLALQGEWFLCAVVTIFSVLFPSGKLALLSYVWNRADSRISPGLLHGLNISGKWSMLDVFVVAVLVATVKLGALASIELHYGLYLFALAVLLIMSLTHWVIRRL